jgi:isopentenyl-diphosphate delta-isomerase
MDELIVLLNEDYQPVGTAPKLASHHDQTPLHLAFSCYIFNQKGELLVTRRAASKKVWPGFWTNSVCGHPLPGESFQDAVARRANHELGITKLQDLTELISEYEYQTPAHNGIVEHEFCPIFAARLNSEIAPNPKEVQDYYWTTWPALQDSIKRHPNTFSYWFKDQMPLLEKTSLLSNYLHT